MPIRSSLPSASESCLSALRLAVVGLGRLGLVLVFGVLAEVEAFAEVRLVVGTE